MTEQVRLQEFFYERVREALQYQNLSISQEVEFYLVNILDYYSKSENLFQKTNDGKVEYRALALKLHDSIFSDHPNRRYQHLKSLGDTALYHAGVFYDGLFNQAVDVDYYINMGGSAYQTLSNLSTTMERTKVLADLYAELGERFAKLVEVLKLCIEQDVAVSDHDILKLLDRYNKTGSRKAKEILEEKGIKPDAFLKNRTVQ